MSELDEDEFASASEGEEGQVQQPATTSWMGWLSGAVAAVNESLQSDVEQLNTLITTSTNNMISTTNDDGKDGGEQDEEIVPAFGVLRAVDKTLDFTSDLLGNAMMTVANNKIVDNGMTALEAIGSVIGTHAAQLLAQQKNTIAQQQQQQQDQKQNDYNNKVKKVKEYFEDNCGNAHLQALQMLGTEANLKVEKGKGDFVEKSVNLDELIETVDGTDEELLITNEEGFKRYIEILNILCVSNHSQASQLQAFLNQPFDCDNRDASVVWKALAEYAEKSCEQILRLSEIMLMMIAEDRLKSDEEGGNVADRVEKFLQAFREFALILFNQLLFLSNIFALENDEKFNDELEQETSFALSLIQDGLQATIPIFKLMCSSK